MLTEEGLSSLDIFFITDDSSLFVSVKEPAKSMIVSAISENIQTNSAFSLIIRLVDVFLLKEQCEIVLAYSKDILVCESWHLFVIVQRRSAHCKFIRRLVSLHIS